MSWTHRVEAQTCLAAHPPGKASEEALFARIVTAQGHYAEFRLRSWRAALPAALAAIETTILVEGALDEVEKRGCDLGGKFTLRFAAEWIALRLRAWATRQQLRIRSGLALLGTALKPALEATGEIFKRRHERPVSYPSVIVPGESDQFLRLRINAGMRVEPGGKQLAGTFSAIAQGGDDVCGHVEVEPALVLSEGDMHDPVTIAGHGHQFRIAPIACGIEKHHEKVDHAAVFDVVETRDILNAAAVGCRHPDVLPRIFFRRVLTSPRLETAGWGGLLHDVHTGRYEIDAEG